MRVLHVVAAGEFGGAEAQILALIRAFRDGDGSKGNGAQDRTSGEKGTRGPGSAPKSEEGPGPGNAPEPEEGPGSGSAPEPENAAGSGNAPEPDEVAVLTFYEGEFSRQARALGVPVAVAGGGPFVGDLRAALAAVREHRPDVVHTHGVRASVAGRLAGRLARVPVVTTVHSDLRFDYSSSAKRALFTGLETATRGLSSRVIAVSRPLREALLRRGYSPLRVVRVENALDTVRAEQALREAEGHPARIRGELGLPGGALIVACVARLHPVKNHVALIEAAGRVPEAGGRPLHLVLAGDGEERRNLEALARERAPGRVHFLGNRQDVFAILRESDAFALVSTMEGLPIAVLEAMFAGLPVIASGVGGLAGLVDKGRRGTGFLVRPDSPSEIASAIRTLFSREGLAREMGERGRERVLVYYSLERMVRETRSVYESVKTPPENVEKR